MIPYFLEETYKHNCYISSSSLGVTTSYIESFGLLNDISPFTTVLDADCPILNLPNCYIFYFIFNN